MTLYWLSETEYGPVHWRPCRRKQVDRLPVGNVMVPLDDRYSTPGLQKSGQVIGQLLSLIACLQVMEDKEARYKVGHSAGQGRIGSVLE